MSHLSLEYIHICKNSENYIQKLKTCDKIIVKQEDICRSKELINRNDPLWGYYNVATFEMHGLNFSAKGIFPEYRILCGNCYMGECYLIKQLLKQT